MNGYCTPEYLLLFLPAFLVLYQLLPKEGRRLLILLAGYLFFWMISGSLLLYLLLSTLTVYLCGRGMDRVFFKRDASLKNAERSEKKAIRLKADKEKKRVLFAGLFINFGILFVLKILPFFVMHLNELLSRLSAGPISLPALAVPIGISFYTLEAASYLLDVSSEKIRADKSLFRLALYLSFFPQIMEGPFARYTDTAMALYEPEPIRLEALHRGCLRIAYGMMKKLVVADRMNMMVIALYEHHELYNGGLMAAAAIFYTIQEYMEFSGTMDIILGSAEIIGVPLPENFRQPLFSKTISEFWTRWHITLGAWLRDYIFYPLSMSKALKNLTKAARKKLGNHFGPLLSGTIALFAVWLFNGFWHGAGGKYLLFAMFHFVLIVTGSAIEPFVSAFCENHRISRQSPPYRFFQMLRTFLLVCISELIFRSLDVSAALSMLKRMITDFTLVSFTDGTILSLGMDLFDFLIVGVSLLIVFVISLLRERGVEIRKSLLSLNLPLRWAIQYGLILFILVFGAYGSGYMPLDPIYANF